LEAASEVEAHGVLRGRRRDDHLFIAGAAGDLLELLCEAAADAQGADGRADVEECQLRSLGPNVLQDYTDGE
jgi:hypothetical protein